MIIYKTVRESVAAVTSIKSYGVGEKSFNNQRDQYDEDATAANKYPLFWLWDVSFKPVGEYGLDFRYTCRAMIIANVTDETPETINQQMQTLAYLVKQFMQSFSLHPAIRNDDKYKMDFDAYELPVFGENDDRTVGWGLTFSCFLNEPAIGCVVPETTLTYVDGGYIDPGFVS